MCYDSNNYTRKGAHMKDIEDIKGFDTFIERYKKGIEIEKTTKNVNSI